MSGRSRSAAPASDRVGDWLAEERSRVDRALAAGAEVWVERMHPRLREPVSYALSTSGKRLRPILCVAAYRAARGGEAPEATYRLACALELVHTYSLVHDDLPCMDDDDLRRGRPTVHRVHGPVPATLAGAALLPLAVGTLVEQGRALGLPSSVTARLTAELCRAAGAAGMVGGQLMDLEGERRTVDATGLEAIHRAKTGALLTASLRIGALAAGAAEETLGALTRYGDALGLAFQIVDDILDVTAGTDALGKTAGRDHALSKASYPALHGLEGARRLARARIEEAKSAVAPLDAPELAWLADFVLERPH